MALSAAYLTTLLVTGFLGSLGHCSGMCGPLVIMVGLRLPQRGLRSVPSFLVYHGARIGVYALLGGVFAAAVALFGWQIGLRDVSGWISLVLGAAVAIFGLSYLGAFRSLRLRAVTPWLSGATQQALKQPGRGSLLLMGAMNGLLPCGLLYSALLIASTSGGAFAGAVGMLAFGLATLPVLLLLGAGAGALSTQFRRRLVLVGGVFVMLVGVQLMLRGAASLGYLHHLMLGGFMLW